jgi:hypothetical protein
MAILCLQDFSSLRHWPPQPVHFVSQGNVMRDTTKTCPFMAT